MFGNIWETFGKPDEFPHVGTTYRLTEHFHYDTFITAGNKEEILNGLPVQFRTGLDGKVRSVLIPLNQEPGAEPIEFVKVPEAPKAKVEKPAPKAEKKPAKKAR